MIAILDLSMGNINSICNAVYECGFDAPIVVDGSQNLDDVTHLIFPGVGHFNAASRIIQDKNISVSLKEYANSGRPLLGICLGMQLFAEFGREGEKSEGFSFIKGSVEKLDSSSGIRIPHVGWNNANIKRNHPVLENIKKDRDFYFTHSYAISCSNAADVIAETEYGQIFPSIVGTKNIIGCQFHPEKSQVNGLTLIENFCRWDGKC
jgi:glutamine amidotransferase